MSNLTTTLSVRIRIDVLVKLEELQKCTEHKSVNAYVANILEDHVRPVLSKRAVRKIKTKSVKRQAKNLKKLNLK